MPTTAGRRDDRQPDNSRPCPKVSAHHHSWRRPTTTQLAPLIFRHPPKVCIGPTRHQDRSSSLRCGRCVLTPALTRCRLHGGRKSAKSLVANVLTEPRPFRDDSASRCRGLIGRESVVVQRRIGWMAAVTWTVLMLRPRERSPRWCARLDRCPGALTRSAVPPRRWMTPQPSSSRLQPAPASSSSCTEGA